MIQAELKIAKAVAWAFANNPVQASGQQPYSVIRNADKYQVVAGVPENALFTCKPGDPFPIK